MLTILRSPRGMIFVLALLGAGCSAGGPHREAISIVRDDFGVPSIFAETPQGAAFASGYAQAEDRLEELLKQYRRAAGTLAEIAGAEELWNDYRMRLWRHEAVSRERYGELSPRARSIIEAYVEGVKLFMRRHPEKVPAWGSPPEPWMLVALGRYIIWGWPEGTAAEELAAAGVEIEKPPARGSNQWLVAGNRTAFGKPMALVDPHLSWYGAFRFYEVRLYGGELQAAGVTILGTPIPTLGHGRYCSVAMTTGGPDTTDVYEITLDPEGHPGKYLYDGAWRDLRVRTETIRVKGAKGIEEVKREFVSTHHGPIVAHKNGKGYAVKISYQEEVGLSDQGYEMMTARNLAAMKRAISRLQLMEQNVMVATTGGDIFYVRNGRVPIRPPGYDFTRPVPGDTSKTEWLGIHSLSDLVQIENPPQGYLQNCNVSPAAMMVDSPLVAEKWKDRPWLFHVDQPYLHQRAAQTRAELHAEKRLTLERAVEIAHSTVVFNAGLWQGRLRAAVGANGEAKDLSEDARTLLRQILLWNGRADEDSTGALAYYYWKEAVFAVTDEVPEAQRLQGEKRLGPVARLADRAGLEPPAVPVERLREALDRAAARLRTDWGGVEVTFGTMFRIQRQGSPRSFPIGGGSLPGMSTPRAVSFSKGPDGKTRVGTGGQTATQIVILTDPPQSFSLLPLGESDDPASPHFDDQAEKLMQRRKLKPTYFLQKEELLKHASSTEALAWPPEEKEIQP